MKYRRPINKNLVISLLIVATILAALMPYKPSIIGWVLTRVYVKPLELNETCQLNMTEGWNLISIACVPANNSIANTFNNISEINYSLHTYITDDPDHWKAFKPGLPGWVIMDIEEISDKEGYWVNLDNDTSMIISGTITYPNRIEMVRGWNLIGYPTNNSKLPSEAFTFIDGKYTIVWAYNSTNGAYTFYDPVTDTGTITRVNPGKGYYVNMTQGGTLWVT